MRHSKSLWIGAALVAVALLLPTDTSAQRRSSSSSSWNDDDGPRETETVEKTVAFPDNGTLRLKNFSGDVHIVAGNGHDLKIKARRRASRERLDHIKLDVQSSGSSVTVNANVPDASWERDHRNNNVVETAMEIEVPASARLDVDVFSSNVTVERVVGDQRLKTFSGEITVRDPRGADINAETFSGDINVFVEPNAKGSVSFHSFSGALESKLNIASMSKKRRDIEGSLPGGAGPRLNFKTFSGDLQIK